jgi:hypothetical protein
MFGSSRWSRGQVAWLLLGAALVVYSSLLLDAWWSQGKGHYPDGSAAFGSLQPPRCTTEDYQPFAIPVTSPHYRRDARFLWLEFHRSGLLYADILGQRPECMAELLAYHRRDGRPYVMLLLDRITGETVARFAFLGGSVSR